ncbi:hypothetical protein [Afipia clevelandensis]|uniref:Cell envelope biogenesis protein TolA n=1 Tax=Afipia clevelandensis ATCC 49720 TaxID=883079 RepID=K8PA38_9BRAD|nr:hypothetical protein [Afipia clevelandensis]EKS35213.1 hypothetical protein HMPREF9696_02485 [Afipia clevelandensis ATCC 49720]
MIKKLFTKYFLEVIPSIVATVVGAYIVTHYINAKSEADKPKAAVAAPAVTAKDAPQTLKADEAGDRPAAAAKAEAARLKAEKLAAEKAAAERAAADRAENAKRAAEKAAEKLAAEKAASEKAAAEKPAAEKRDASDLARAAIERLRKASPQPAEQPRAADVAQGQERARVNAVVYAPAAQQPAVQPLPPAVNVAPPPSESVAASPAPFPRPIDSADSRDDSLRLTPPADIPTRPVDLSAKQRRSVTEDVVSAARSVFHAVVPESSN